MRSVNPGHSLAEIVASTGFDLIVPAQVPETTLPTPEELTALRERVDPKGVLR